MKKTKIFLFILTAGIMTLAAQTRPDALKEYRAGNLDRAIEICRLELEDSPGNMDSYTVMGWSLIKQEKYQEALDEGMKALSYNRHDIRILEIVAEANFFTGKNLEALVKFPTIFFTASVFC